jgi:hypothetical protein
MSPAYSPCDPALGCSDTRSKPVISASWYSSLPEQLREALRLVPRRERVDAVEAAPADRHHLARGIQLHRAAAERDHGVAQREVPRLEALDVAQHLGLGVVPVEHRVREVRARARQRLRDGARRLHADVVQHERQRLVQREDRDEVGHVAQRGGLVERNAEAGGREHPQIDLPRARRIHHPGQGPALELDAQRVEEVVVHDAVAQPAQRIRQDHGARMRALRDAAEAARPVVDGVHAGHDGEQHLRRADVAGGLLATDVLLARLQRHAERGPAVDILRHADDATRHVALELVPGGEEGGMRAAIAHRYTEALRIADGDVRAPFAGRGQQREREQVGGTRHDRLRRMRLGAQRAEVAQRAVGARVLHQAAHDAGHELELLHRLHLHGDAASFRARDHHRHRLRMAIGVDEVDGMVVPRGDRERERHRLGGRGGLIEQRCVRHRQRGEVHHHRLEVEQRLEPPLGDLGLVGRVRRVPAGILEDVALDHLRHEGAVVAHADVRAEDLVLLGHAAQSLQHLALASARRKLERAAEADVLGHHGVDERVE